MGDVVFLTIKARGTTHEARGILLADRIYDCTFEFDSDPDENRECYRKIETAIASGLQSVTLSKFNVSWRIVPPWEIEEEND